MKRKIAGLVLAVAQVGCDGAPLADLYANHDIGCFLSGLALGVLCAVGAAYLVSDEDQVSR